MHTYTNTTLMVTFQTNLDQPAPIDIIAPIVPKENLLG